MGPFIAGTSTFVVIFLARIRRSVAGRDLFAACDSAKYLVLAVCCHQLRDLRPVIRGRKVIHGVGAQRILCGYGDLWLDCLGVWPQ